jgi:hypothetical protein
MLSNADIILLLFCLTILSVLAVIVLVAQAIWS